MKKWKKWTALLCAGAMLVSLTACGTLPAGSDSMAAYAGQSVTGQITVLDGTSVTLQIGELRQSHDMQPSDATPPEKPESDASGDTAAEDAGTQPSDATLPTDHSEALVIEGENRISLENCDVTGNMSDTEGASSDENVHNVMIYQSMSGDANVGTAEFSMTGGSLTGKNGDLIYVTNISCTMRLSGVTLENEDADGLLLRVAGNAATHGWGTTGSNGARVDFTADAQVLTGGYLRRRDFLDADAAVQRQHVYRRDPDGRERPKGHIGRCPGQCDDRERLHLGPDR